MWLLDAAEDATALLERSSRVWGKMLAALDIPEALRGWPLQLGHLPHLLGSRERRAFATHFTWAAHALTQARPAIRRSCLRRLDRNKSEFAAVAAQLLCCRGRRQCSKSILFARKLPTIPAEVQAVVLGGGGDPYSAIESVYRAMLFEVEANSGAALAGRLAQTNPHLLYSQLEYALQAGVFSGRTTQLVVGGLVASTLVGTEVRPEELGVSPVTIAQALRKTSADAIATFVAEHRRLNVVDPLDAGTCALSKFLRRHRLRAMQLAKWAAAVAPPDCESLEGERSSSWPPPRGWNAAREMSASNDITPLLSIGAIVREGVKQSNCLAHGDYHDRAAAGLVHLFSLRHPQRTTLALEEHRDGSRVVGYEIAEFKARRNQPPGSPSWRRAEELVVALNVGLSIEGGEIDPDELERRRQPTRSFVAETAVAEQLWKALVGSLPRRFHQSPRSIVEEFADERSRNGQLVCFEGAE